MCVQGIWKVFLVLFVVFPAKNDEFSRFRPIDQIMKKSKKMDFFEFFEILHQFKLSGSGRKWPEMQNSLKNGFFV